MLNDEPPLAVETILFSSSAVRIGMFRCGVDDVNFSDSGPIQNHIFVFPRTSVRIRHDGGESFVAGPNLVTLYNRRTVYRRSSVAGQPDFCDWFALAPDILLEVLGERDPRVAEQPERPFKRAYTNSSNQVYLRQRRLIAALQAGWADPLQVEEESVAILRELAGPESIRPNLSSKSARERIEAVKELLATTPGQPRSLRQLADSVGLSVYHLCRVFRKQTGYTVHAFRQQMAMRQALERVADGDDLLDVAIEFHYSSHSHFTSRFRLTFGAAPSEVRAEMSQSPRRFLTARSFRWDEEACARRASS